MRHKQIDEIYECIKYNTGSYDDDARSCAEILYDYLGYRKSEWISVEDRLPEENTDVLIYRGGFRGDLMNVYTYMGHNEWEDEYGYWSITDDEGITHWMPLPEPPKD
jgi:hypothetical protein